MTDRIPEVSSDLEWMLQSGQVDLHVLAEAMVEAWFERVYRLAAAFYKNTDDAIYATIETFNTLLLDIHRYKSESGVTIWVCRTILEVFERVQKEKRLHNRDKSQAFEQISRPSSFLAEPQAEMVNKVLDTLNREDRLLTLFRYLLKLSLDELAIIYKSDVKTIQLRLQVGRSRLRREIESSVFAADSLKTGFLDRFFELVLQKLWFSSPLEPDFLKQAHAEIVFQVNNRKQSRDKKFSYQEFGWIGGVALVVILLILGVGNIFPKSDLDTPPLQKPASQEPLISQENQPGKNHPMDKAIPESLPKAYMHYIVLPDDTVEIVASRLGVSVQELRNANNIPADGTILPGQILVIESGRETSQKGHQAQEPVATLQPSGNNSSDLLQKRILETKNYYQSFWGEAQVFYYGPAGYIGPPRGYRVQIWYEAPGNYLLVGGRIHGNPDSIILVRNQPSQPEEVYISYRSDQDGHWFYQSAAELNHLDSVFRLNYSFDALDQVLQTLNFQPLTSVLTPSSKESIAGQDTIVVTLVDPQNKSRSKIWVDAITGLILRRQTVSGRENSLVEVEALFVDIQYNQEFPAGLFEPFNYLPAEFGIDPMGWPGGMTLGGGAPALWMPPAHPPLSYPPAPKGFDVSKSWLIFQYPASYDFHSSRSLVELFTNNYFLGVVRFGNPWTMICDRSPDGDKIAFVSMPDGPVQGTILNWFSLSDPRLEVKDVLGEINIKEIVFAQNSNQLAVFGKYGSSGGVYVIETASHGVRRLRRLANASSLVWSPDNEYLAMIARQSEQDDYELFLVLRVSDGEIVYSSVWGQDVSSLLPDAPVLEWGVQFPSQTQGLDGCAQPKEESR